MNEEINEMMLDLDTFNFEEIDEGEAEEVEVSEEAEVSEENEIEDLEEEVEEGAEGVEVADAFNDLAEDYEFTIDGATVTKGDLVDTIKSREQIKEAQASLLNYMQVVNAKTASMESIVETSITESELKLQEINRILANPTSVDPVHLQRVLQAKNDTEKRVTMLRDNAAKLQQEKEHQMEELNKSRIYQTDMALKGVAGYTGMDSLREVCQWAQGQGIDGNAVIAGMSPGLIKVLMDAKRYQEVRSQKASKIKPVVKQAPTSTTTKPKSTTVKSTSAKAAIKQKAEKGLIPVTFDMIED